MQIALSSPVFSFLVLAFMPLLCTEKSDCVVKVSASPPTSIKHCNELFLFRCRESAFLNWTSRNSSLCKQELCLLNVLQSTQVFLKCLIICILNGKFSGQRRED